MKVKFVLLFSLILSTSIFGSQNSAPEKYWIFFKDKPALLFKSQNINSLSKSLEITQKAMERRRKLRTTSQVVNYKDLPVDYQYLQKIEKLNLNMIAESRWLNGVSVWLTPDLKTEIAQWDCVRKVQKVKQFAITPINYNERPVISGSQIIKSNIDYGSSQTQNEMIHVPELHALDLSGKGILIGLIDSGFQYKTHDCFSHVNIIDEYDFVFDDDTTANQSNDDNGQDNHGSYVLSIIAGFDEGELVGPAYAASYLLAKTEYVPTEIQIEEDYWVEAIEWMEREGVDIVSTSLGYSVFDNGNNYNYHDMDGNTAVTTIAADIAASKGVVMITSAGNERNSSWKYITSPADGDSVIAVGAVHLQNGLTYFSSVGPTADGRIKPDVVAMGMTVIAAAPESIDGYHYVQGTSFSAPQVAGVAALLLEAHPSLDVMQVRDALRLTADRAMHPDSLYGWGLVNAYEALFYHGPYIKNVELLPQTSSRNTRMFLTIQPRYDSQESLHCYYRTDSAQTFQRQEMTLYKTEFDFVYTADFASTINFSQFECYFEVEDSLGSQYTLPVNAPLFTYKTSDEESSPFFIDYQEEPAETTRLYATYPNPFNPLKGSVKIQFDLLGSQNVVVKIVNIMGSQVKTLLNAEVLERRAIQIEWDGRNNHEDFVASGLYFVVLESCGKQSVKKMLVLK